MYSVPPSLKPVQITKPWHCSKHVSLGSWGDKGGIGDLGTTNAFLAAVLANNTEHCKPCLLLKQRPTSMGKDLWCTCCMHTMWQEGGWGVHKQRWGVQQYQDWPHTKPAAVHISSIPVRHTHFWSMQYSPACRRRR